MILATGGKATATEVELAAPVRLNLLIAGTYAWVTTVAAPVFSRSVEWLPRLTAGAALVALVAGVMSSRRWPTLGRWITMAGFLGLSCLTWVALGDALTIEQVEPVRAASGSAGWVLFALGWGSVRQPDAVPENDPRVIEARPLGARRTVPRRTLVAFVLALALGLMPWMLAWGVTRAEQAVLAHMVGLAAAMWFVDAGAKTAVALGEGAPKVTAAVRLRGLWFPALVLSAVLWVWHTIGNLR